MKKVLLLAASPRKNGNSAALCREFARGVAESGHHAEMIFLRDKKIGCCLACYHCKGSGGVCAIKDDMAEMLAKMNAADVIVMASPVYFYSIDAQMKALIDRSVAQWLQIKNKEFYYIMTAAEDSDTVMDCTLEIYYGDNIPKQPVSEPHQEYWRASLRMAKLWADAVNRHGGDVTVVHLPEAGLKGNTHFPFSDMNNDEVADLLSQWLKEKGLDQR